MKIYVYWILAALALVAGSAAAGFYAGQRTQRPRFAFTSATVSLVSPDNTENFNTVVRWDAVSGRSWMLVMRTKEQYWRELPEVK